jgi:hypothetical protein
MADFPIVNGKTFDFSAIETSVPLAGIIREINEISYSDSIERGELRSGQPWVDASTTGDYSAEASITLSKQWHTRLITKLEELALAAGLPGPYDYEFPLNVVYEKPGMPRQRDQLKKCSLIGSEFSGSRGPDPLLITVPIYLHAVYWNGVKPFRDMPF